MANEHRKVFFNGKFIPEYDAKVSIYDSSLMFGDMVFEMTRSFNKEHFKLKEHIDRLFTGLKILRIKIDMTKKQMFDACIKTSEINAHLFDDTDEHRLMIDVSRGLLSIYQNIETLHKGPNIIIADFPLKWTVAGMGELFDEGINAVITQQRVIPADLMDPKIKNRSRLFYLMANIQASEMVGKNNWALMLDTDGFVAEGTGTNFFIIKDGKIISPEGRNILRGVSRQYIIDQLCPKLKIPIIEKNIEPYDVYNADEAFMSGTPFCVLPVTKINNLNIGDGKVGPIYSELLEAWSKETKVDIKKQIKFWNKNFGNRVEISPYKFK
jgi:branched-chain amino acid aminotransferase